jgi:murein DD-endopeptidase MepM/ murein hydrolase activator NlpD
MRSRIILISIFLLALGATFLFRRPHTPDTGDPWLFTDHLNELQHLTDSLNSVLADTLSVRIAWVEEGGTLGALLYSTGIEGNRYLSCCNIFIDSLGWTSVHLGDTLEAVYARDTLTEVRARPRNGRGYYCIEFDDTAEAVDWYWVPEEQYRRIRAVTLAVQSSVWESIASSGIPEDLTPSGRIVTSRDSVREVAYIKGFENELANRLFVYDIDFYYDVQPGDSVWVLVEETRYPGSSETTFRRIIAAKYDFSLGGMTEAIPYFHRPDSLAPDGTVVILDHYHRDGASLRTMFLKMPVPFGRISSPFSDSRMHPVLGYTRAHRGIDYAAPMGTEIYAVGDGVITVRGVCGGYGNMVRIRHANGYETGYGHMNGFAANQEIGSYVRQGDIIGYVGSTGLSTGPHVHFEMKKNGSYVNPATEILPPANPLLDDDLAYFMLQLPVLESTWSIMSGMDIPILPIESTDPDSTSSG